MKVLRTTVTSGGEKSRSDLCHLVVMTSFDIIAGYSFYQWMRGGFDEWWYTFLHFSQRSFLFPERVLG